MDKKFTSRKQLVKHLAECLGETEETPLKDLATIVEIHSENYCLKLLEDAQKLHQAHIKTKDETRPRTLGGCFFMLEKFRVKGKI